MLTNENIWIRILMGSEIFYVYLLLFGPATSLIKIPRFAGICVTQLAGANTCREDTTVPAQRSTKVSKFGNS